MKRIVSLVLCMALAIGSVTYKPPQAKAVVFDGAFLGSLYGSVMGSMGLSYATGSMNNQSFGLAIWDLMTSWYTDMTPEGESALEFLGNLASAGIQAMAPGQVLLNQSLIESISQFAHWLYDKYALAENESAVVSPGVKSITFTDGTMVSLGSVICGDDYMTAQIVGGDVIPAVESSTWVRFNLTDDYYIAYQNYVDATYWRFPLISVISGGSDIGFRQKVSSYASNPYEQAIHFGADDNYLYFGHTVSTTDGVKWNCNRFPLSSLTVNSTPALSVSSPNGLSISDVESVTPEQAYALTFEGVTATDVQGIVNEAVGRILDGTYSAAGEITDALDVPQDLTWQEHIAQIWENIKALPQTIAQAIASAFAPDAELVEEITTTFSNKFGWLETIHRFGQDLFGMTADTAPPVIYIHLEDAEGKYTYGGMEKALDMTWYQRYKADVDRILSGFMWIAFLWLVFKRASAIIQGGEMITEYTNDLDQGHR